MKVGLVGIGHVGLPTAAALAHIGHDVVAMDADREKVDQLTAGVMPFYEEGMEELVRRCISSGRLAFSSEMRDVVDGAEVVFICVGTPPRATGEANLLAIEQAAQSVAREATDPFVLVQKSTVPAGTATKLLDAISRYRSEVRFSVVANPEFLREGSAIEDSLRPARILVGSDSSEALDVMRELYRPLIDAGADWIATDVRTAELAKHACNAFLSMKISFANAMARLCELADADVVAVAEAMGSDERIGRAFLGAGLGYGGYCFPKDLAAFGALANRLGYDFALLKEIAKINDEAVTSTFKKIEEAMWNLEEKKIALLGLAFKAGTDDTRLSPSLVLARSLIEAGAQVVGYDPQANANAKADVAGLDVAPDAYEALQDAHCAVISTEWHEFRDLDLERARDAMAFPIIVDARNLLDGPSVAAAGFTYIPTGRPVLRPHRAEERA
ncbi:MAG: UDP-glucose dehydrogenase family protein [Actinomycetota bacterium]